MINKRNAMILIYKTGQQESAICKDIGRAEMLRKISEIDKKLMLDEFYASLCDMRQAVIVALHYSDNADIANKIIDIGQDFEKASKAIKSSPWGKKKANKDKASKLACQYLSGKPCGEGCNCG